MSSTFYLDDEQVEQLNKAIEQLANPRVAFETVQEYLQSDGVKEIENSIYEKIPESGRSWKGKAAAAKSVDPFKHMFDWLSVNVATKPKYQYLYFPDDGSNTKRHAGEQHFFDLGLEESQEHIVDEVIRKLTEKMEEIL